MKYQKGFEFIVDKDMNTKDLNELKQVISKFFINKGFEDAQVSQIGLFDKNLQRKWEQCKKLL